MTTALQLSTLALWALLSSTPLHAVTTAVIDSGIDGKHKDLSPLIWRNPLESENTLDDDDNGLVDDLIGWNFLNDNNVTFNYSLLGTFSPDIFQFFRLQAKLTTGTASSNEIQWMRKKLVDQKFQRDLDRFANFAHGTHVAGISVKHNQDTKILTVRMISDADDDNGDTTSPLVPDEDLTTEDPSSTTSDSDWREDLRRMAAGKTPEERKAILERFLKDAALAQMKQLHEIAAYLHGQKVRVANGSFGTGPDQVYSLVRLLFQPIMDKAPTTKEEDTYMRYFFTHLLSEAKVVMEKAPQTFFVFAAGNEAEDNDELPNSPTNVASDNSIAVAATMSYSKLAKFSNYGKTTVHVAAPGVNIVSTIPGDEFMPMSGTSQAAPFVSAVAAEMLRVNNALAPKDLKHILCQTVDKLPSLKSKVACGGIVNRDRAIRAAFLNKEKEMAEAIKMANTEIPDVEESNLKGFNLLSPTLESLIRPAPVPGLPLPPMAKIIKGRHY